MRKLTGYIGALIIVFALMGSILAGYALNVNGSSSVINEYERVTDVSGLYSHTQEPSYIDYNPASNYIGYNIKQSGTFTITNTSPLAGGMSYKLYKGSSPNCAWNASHFSDGAFYVNGAVVPYSNTGQHTGLTAYKIVVGDGTDVYVWNPTNNPTVELHINGGRYWSSNFTITYNNNTLRYTLIDNGNQVLTASCSWLIMPSANGDYVPVISGNTGYYQDGLYKENTGSYTINQVDEWNGEPVFNLYSINNPNSNYWAFVPKTVYYQPTIDKGINYTETNRVNNYPVGDPNPTTTITNHTVNLNAMSAADYQLTSVQNRYYYSTNNDFDNMMVSYPRTGPHAYKLSDVLSTVVFPAGTNRMDISIPTEINSLTDAVVDITYEYPTNWAFMTVGGPLNRNYTTLDNYNQTARYYVSNNIVEVYDKDGVKIGTATPDNIYINFVKPNERESTVYYAGSSRTSNVYYPEKTAPYISISSYSTVGPDIHYMDITKGFTVKNDNTVNVIWNNEYTNGNIQLLFRAENASGIYHNDIIVGDNTISIDYVDNGYSVSLNSGDPVNIGKWRNIVLNIDLRNGELTAIPVRTFNSYTNVVMDTASIVIGELINSTPTNIIEWAPTSNSLMFNVYSTAVFMNTYGVVMVNPQLDITEYFTDLNGFYRMRLYNFSVLGSSITVNGVTADVSNNSITIDNQTVQFKDMAITYADGHAYISDSNVNIDLGEVVNNNVSMTGAWYFETELLKGYTSQKMVYTWDWGDFILNNTQFCVMYIGIALVALMIARRYCSLSITDYIVLIVSFAIALTVQVVA